MPNDVFKDLNFKELYTKYGFDKTKYDPKWYDEEDLKRIFLNSFDGKVMCLCDSAGCIPQGYIAFGERIFEEEDDYIPDIILDTDTTPLLEQIKEDFELQDFDIKIICGSRCC